MKNKHRIKQDCRCCWRALRFQCWRSAARLCRGCPATPETAEAATPETAEANVPRRNLCRSLKICNDLPDAPTGSYLGSMGLPVATGETKSVSPRGFLTCMTA